MGDTGAVEEKAWNFEHKGDDTKATMVASAATVLVNNVKEVFGAQGLLTKWFKEHQLPVRGPVDFPRRRRRDLRATNGDEGGPVLAAIFALLLLVLISVVVMLFQLYTLKEGQTSHERRIYQLERNRSAGHAPS